MYLKSISLFSLCFLGSSFSQFHNGYGCFLGSSFSQFHNGHGFNSNIKATIYMEYIFRAHLKIQDFDKMSLLNVYLLWYDNLD